MPNTAGQSGQTYFDSPILNGPTPPEGAKAMAVNCPFTAQNTAFDIDLTLSQTQNYISLIQGVFLDNSANADVVSIVSNGATNQRIEFPAGAQGYIPLLATKPTSFTVTSAGAVTVPIILLNVAVPAIIWGGSSGGGGGTVTLTNPGSQPAVTPAESVPLTSDAAGNLMVTINAAVGGEGQDPYTGAITPIYAQNGGLSVYTVNDVSVTPATNATIFRTAPGYDSYQTAQFALSSSPVLLFAGTSGVDAVTIHNKTGLGNCYIGNDDTVTASTGFLIEPGETLSMDGVLENMYAMSDTTTTISIITRGD
jgi:hypothetical protein